MPVLRAACNDAPRRMLSVCAVVYLLKGECSVTIDESRLTRMRAGSEEVRAKSRPHRRHPVSCMGDYLSLEHANRIPT
jgi:hypothetical protein